MFDRSAELIVGRSLFREHFEFVLGEHTNWHLHFNQKRMTDETVWLKSLFRLNRKSSIASAFLLIEAIRHYFSSPFPVVCNAMLTFVTIAYTTWNKKNVRSKREIMQENIVPWLWFIRFSFDRKTFPSAAGRFRKHCFLLGFICRVASIVGRKLKQETPRTFYKLFEQRVDKKLMRNYICFLHLTQWQSTVIEIVRVSLRSRSNAGDFGLCYTERYLFSRRIHRRCRCLVDRKSPPPNWWRRSRKLWLRWSAARRRRRRLRKMSARTWYAYASSRQLQRSLIRFSFLHWRLS